MTALQRTARIVDFERALEELRAPGLFRFYGASLHVGRTARLLETVRGYASLPKAKVYDFASQFGYSPDFVEASLFPKFSKWGLIDIAGDNVKVNITSPGQILELCGKYWEELPKDPRDNHAVDAVELISKRPIELDDLHGRVFADTTEDIEKDVLVTLEALNVIVPQKTDEGKVYYTPHFIGSNPDKLGDIIRSLKEKELRALEGVYDTVSGVQGFPAAVLVRTTSGVSDALLSTAAMGGLVNVCEVNTLHDSQKFVFTGDILPSEGIKSDAFHFTKQTVSHFRYAQTFPRYKLRDVPRFLEVLLEKGQAGAASPIGTDYKFLEQNGIVDVQELGVSGRFTMYLVPGKEDILKAAMDLITSGTPPIPKLEEMPLAEQLKRIKVPPEHRVGLDPMKFQALMDRLMRALRKGRW